MGFKYHTITNTVADFNLLVNFYRKNYPALQRGIPKRSSLAFKTLIKAGRPRNACSFSEHLGTFLKDSTSLLGRYLQFLSLLTG